MDQEEIRLAMVGGSWTSPITKQTVDGFWAKHRVDSLRFVRFEKKTFRLFKCYTGVAFAPSPITRFNKKEKKEWSVEVPFAGAVAFRSGGLESLARLGSGSVKVSPF